MNNGRFAVATHMLTLLALHPEPQSKIEVAASVRANPVTIRKIVICCGRPDGPVGDLDYEHGWLQPAADVPIRSLSRPGIQLRRR